MKSFFAWVANNAALSFLLGLQIICFSLGAGWVISSYLDDFKTEATETTNIAQVLIVAEEGQTDFITSEMEVFSSTHQADYKVVIYPREEAIKMFASQENAILILSDQLKEEELTLSDISGSRLPLRQDLMDDSSSSLGLSPIFIRDNSSTIQENLIASFFENNASQDLVYQKIKSKMASKPALQNG